LGVLTVVLVALGECLELIVVIRLLPTSDITGVVSLRAILEALQRLGARGILIARVQLLTTLLLKTIGTFRIVAIVRAVTGIFPGLTLAVSARIRRTIVPLFKASILLDTDTELNRREGKACSLQTALSTRLQVIRRAFIDTIEDFPATFVVKTRLVLVLTLILGANQEGIGRLLSARAIFGAVPLILARSALAVSALTRPRTWSRSSSL